MTRVAPSRYLVFVLLAGIGLAWDLYSKAVVFRDLGYVVFEAGAPPAPVPGEHALFPAPAGPRGEPLTGQTTPFLEGWLSFRLHTSFNKGALWGIGQELTWLFAAMSVIAVAFVIYWLFIRGAAQSAWLTVALALIVAGALGNLFDRLGLHGCANPLTGEPIHAVRDFLYFRFGTFDWPVFNFADVYLVTGAIMLVVQSFLAEEAGTDRGKASAGTSESGSALSERQSLSAAG